MSNDNKNNLKATFKAGDAVLCPSVGNDTYTLANKSKDCLTINIGNVECLYRADGRAYHDDDYVLPSLFHDTQANRQAIATLYSGNQRTVIDTTSADDKAVIIIASHNLCNILCDISGAADALADVGQLLGLIHYDKISAHTAVSMARLAHDATSTWSEILYKQLDDLNEPLILTGYSRVGKS